MISACDAHENRTEALLAALASWDDVRRDPMSTPRPPTTAASRPDRVGHARAS
jgi:hypothetical protein